ncbi:MAG: hypothetical protein E7266_03080 [Lachnospiraceae bacterium]|nr:hypothetical protein [Lachnospiraceae bacterium]
MNSSFTGKNAIVIVHSSYGMEDAVEFMTKKGISVTLFSSDEKFDIRNEKFENEFYDIASKKHYDFVFSFNYYPIVSHCCNTLCTQGYDIKYLSLVYDNPHILLYTYTLAYPCNRVFTFDYSQYIELYNGGIKHIYYTPLPVYMTRLDRQIGKLTDTSSINYKHDITFIGSMYNESHTFYDKLIDSLKDTSPYACGYLDALVEAQSHLYGAYILEDGLNDEIMNIIYNAFPYDPGKHSIATKKFGYANYFLGRKVAEIERKRLLSLLSEYFDVSLYTKLPTPELPKLHNLGPIDYYEKMPAVFRNSKINLNISLKTIKTGIPLRCMDIMACGGFLLTNYQEDFLRHFTPDVDFVYYTSDEDMLTKAEYYLSHDKERKEIAYNGYQNIRNNYTYENIFSQLIEICLE